MKLYKSLKIPAVYVVGGFLIGGILILILYLVLNLTPLGKNNKFALSVNNPFISQVLDTTQNSGCKDQNYYQDTSKKYELCYPKSWRFYKENKIDGQNSNSLVSFYSYNFQNNSVLKTDDYQNLPVNVKLDISIETKAEYETYKTQLEQYAVKGDLKVGSYSVKAYKIPKDEINTLSYIYYIIDKDTAYKLNINPSAYKRDTEIYNSKAWEELIKVLSSFKLLN